jgi:hypothetical protein
MRRSATGVICVRRPDYVPSTSKCSCVRGILLRPPVEQVLTDIEDEGGDHANEDEAAREDHEDLPSRALGVSC